MFIKLTRPDNTPIWLNAAFIVTVEPRRGGGAVVVPVGDGLDYDVRETPEQVLALLDGAPVPEILPIPSKDALTKTPDDVSAEAESINQLVNEARQTPVRDERPVGAPDAAVPDVPADAVASEKPAKTPRKAAVKKPRASRKAKRSTLPITDEQLERLRRMAPGSVRKLQNTLQSQFKVEDAEDAVRALVANGFVSLDRDHVAWLA